MSTENVLGGGGCEQTYRELGERGAVLGQELRERRRSKRAEPEYAITDLPVVLEDPVLGLLSGGRSLCAVSAAVETLILRVDAIH